MTAADISGRTRHFNSSQHAITPRWSANLTLPDYGGSP